MYKTTGSCQSKCGMMCAVKAVGVKCVSTMEVVRVGELVSCNALSVFAEGTFFLLLNILKHSSFITLFI